MNIASGDTVMGTKIYASIQYGKNSKLTGKVIFEALEPRVLLSADPFPGIDLGNGDATLEAIDNITTPTPVAKVKDNFKNPKQEIIIEPASEPQQTLNPILATESPKTPVSQLTVEDVKGGQLREAQQSVQRQAETILETVTAPEPVLVEPTLVVEPVVTEPVIIEPIIVASTAPLTETVPVTEPMVEPVTAMEPIPVEPEIQNPVLAVESPEAPVSQLTVEDVKGGQLREAQQSVQRQAETILETVTSPEPVLVEPTPVVEPVVTEPVIIEPIIVTSTAPLTETVPVTEPMVEPVTVMVETIMEASTAIEDQTDQALEVVSNDATTLLMESILPETEIPNSPIITENSLQLIVNSDSTEISGFKVSGLENGILDGNQNILDNTDILESGILPDFQIDDISPLENFELNARLSSMIQDYLAILGVNELNGIQLDDLPPLQVDGEIIHKPNSNELHVAENLIESLPLETETIKKTVDELIQSLEESDNLQVFDESTGELTDETDRSPKPEHHWVAEDTQPHSKDEAYSLFEMESDELAFLFISGSLFSISNQNSQKNSLGAVNINWNSPRNRDSASLCPILVRKKKVNHRTTKGFSLVF